MLAADFRPGPQPELTLTRGFRHPIERVWAALVTPERLAEWMGVEWLGGAGPLRDGGDFDYRFRDTDLESRGKVLRLEPPRLLQHSWFDQVAPGTVVTWALEPEGGGCRLTLTQRFARPDDAPRTAAGWTMLLDALDRGLGMDAGKSRPNWFDLRDQYAEALGEESTRDGRLVETPHGPALRFVRVLRQPPTTVWASLTDPAAMPRWMQADVVLEPRVGGRLAFDFHGMDAAAEGRVEAFEPPRRVVFTWPDRVEITLEPHPLGCRLTLTAWVKPEAAVDNAGGWHWHLDALEPAIEGKAVTLDWPRIRMLEKVYAATLERPSSDAAEG